MLLVTSAAAMDRAFGNSTIPAGFGSVPNLVANAGYEGQSSRARMLPRFCGRNSTSRWTEVCFTRFSHGLGESRSAIVPHFVTIMTDFGGFRQSRIACKLLNYRLLGFFRIAEKKERLFR